MEKSEKLKKVRKALGLNQTEMANKLHIKQSYYSALETGKRGITHSVIDSLINDFNVSSTWLYHNTGDIFNTNSNIQLKNEPEKMNPNESFYAKNAQGEYDIISKFKYDNQLLANEITKKVDNLSKGMSNDIVFYLLEINRYLKMYRSKIENKTINEKEDEESRIKILEAIKSIESIDNVEDIQENILLKFRYIDKLREAIKLLLDATLENSKALYLSSIEVDTQPSHN